MNPTFYITKALSGQYYCDRYGLAGKKINITKALGGAENIRRSRRWTYHGGGWWVQEWWITDLEKTKQSLQQQNYEFVIKE